MRNVGFGEWPLGQRLIRSQWFAIRFNCILNGGSDLVARGVRETHVENSSIYCVSFVVEKTRRCLTCRYVRSSKQLYQLPLGRLASIGRVDQGLGLMPHSDRGGRHAQTVV